MRREGTAAVSGAQWRPSLVGGIAHDTDSRIGLSVYAPDQRAAPLPVMRAGPDHVPPLGGRGNSHGPAVSTAGLTCAAASAAFGRIGGGVFLNFDVSASPCLAADDAAHDGADCFPCSGFAHAPEGRSKHVQEVGTFTQGGPRDCAG